MKKTLLAIPLLLLSCVNGNQDEKPIRWQTAKEYRSQRVKIETLNDGVSHGLHKMTIDDTTHILIYRGVESVTMIQVK